MADAYKTLFQGQIATTAGVLATVGAGKSWIVSHIVVTNTNATGTLTFQLFKNGTTAAFEWGGVKSVAAGGEAEWDGLMDMAAAETIAGVASGAGVYIVIEGDEVS